MSGPAPVLAFPVAPRFQVDQLRASLFLRIRVVCEQQHIGNTIHTQFCPDGYLCRHRSDKEKKESKTDAKYHCEPGPEVLRQQQKKAEQEWARNHKLEVERGHAETERQLQQFERRSREQTDSDKIVPTLPQGSRIRMGLPGTQYKQPMQANPAQGSGAPASSGGRTNPGAAIGAAINAAGNALYPPAAVTSAPASHSSEPSIATAPNRPAQMSGASAPSPQSATGPKILPGLTKQQCTARGGRIITYTNTAGVGPDVGECFVPANIAAGGANATRAPRHTEPRRFPGKPAPDIRQEIRALSEALAAMSDDAPDRPRLLRNLMRLMADNRVRLTTNDLACLQPVSRTGPKQIDLPLRWHPYHIKKEAIDRSGLCKDTPVGDALDACREENYGRAVMWAEPEIAGQCRTANAPGFAADAIAECSKRRFLDAWARNNGVVRAPIPTNRVTPAGCDFKITAAQRKISLRDQLRARLRAAWGDDDEDDDHVQPPSVQTVAPAPSADLTAPEPTPVDDDEAYCNYMARQVVRGELTPGASTAIPPSCKATIAAALALKAKQQAEGARPFTMNAIETEQEIAKLIGTIQPSSK